MSNMALKKKLSSFGGVALSGGGETSNKIDKGSLRKRLKELLALPENQVCVHCRCSDPKPEFAVLFANPVESDGLALGAFCCFPCQRELAELGEEVCQMKSLIKANNSASNWSEQDIEALEKSGNAIVNSIYEASFTARERIQGVSMRHKYQFLNYFSKQVYEQVFAKPQNPVPGVSWLNNDNTTGNEKNKHNTKKSENDEDDDDESIGVDELNDSSFCDSFGGDSADDDKEASKPSEKSFSYPLKIPESRQRSNSLNRSLPQLSDDLLSAPKSKSLHGRSLNGMLDGDVDKKPIGSRRDRERRQKQKEDDPLASKSCHERRRSRISRSRGGELSAALEGDTKIRAKSPNSSIEKLEREASGHPLDKGSTHRRKPVTRTRSGSGIKGDTKTSRAKSPRRSIEKLEGEASGHPLDKGSTHRRKPVTRTTSGSAIKTPVGRVRSLRNGEMKDTKDPLATFTSHEPLRRRRTKERESASPVRRRTSKKPSRRTKGDEVTAAKPDEEIVWQPIADVQPRSGTPKAMPTNIKSLAEYDHEEPLWSMKRSTSSPMELNKTGRSSTKETSKEASKNYSFSSKKNDIAMKPLKHSHSAADISAMDNLLASNPGRASSQELDEEKKRTRRSSKNRADGDKSLPMELNKTGRSLTKETSNNHSFSAKKDDIPMKPLKHSHSAADILAMDNLLASNPGPASSQELNEDKKRTRRSSRNRTDRDKRRSKSANRIEQKKSPSVSTTRTRRQVSKSPVRGGHYKGRRAKMQDNISLNLSAATLDFDLIAKAQDAKIDRNIESVTDESSSGSEIVESGAGNGSSEQPAKAPKKGAMEQMKRTTTELVKGTVKVTSKTTSGLVKGTKKTTTGLVKGTIGTITTLGEGTIGTIATIGDAIPLKRNNIGSADELDDDSLTRQFLR